MYNGNRCLAAALGAFPYEGKIVAMEPFGSGHINDTYAVFVEGHPTPRLAYVLQRLNTRVFRDPGAVMENIHGVTGHIRNRLREQGGEEGQNVLHFLQTLDGQNAFTDDEGMPWRSYRFIEHSFCTDGPPSPALFCESGRAFGSFLGMLGDYPVDSLQETIPHFHNTPRRLAQLRAAAERDSLGRLAECGEELAFALAREEESGVLLRMQQRGKLPLRVTHNDTKLNNVLFDTYTHRARCVIDLDTIMPGLSAHDFGDSIRYGATTAAEDETDLERVRFSEPLFEAYTRGYLAEAGRVLTPAEKEALPLGAKVVTLECGIRFLTDYLEGDAYFRTERPGQNLDRCRTQFKLLQEMEKASDRMQRIVERHAEAYTNS